MPHTPGPWRAVIRANQKGVRMAAVDMSAQGGLVWEPTSKRRNEMLPDNAKDDAKLIAAAPDLLIAMRAIHAHLTNEDDCLAICEELARASIAKAT